MGKLVNKTDAAGNAITELLPGTEQTISAQQQAIQAIGKLTYAINADNRLTLTFLATPATSGGPGKLAVTDGTGGHGPELGSSGNLNGNIDSVAHKLTDTAYDTSLKWSTEFDKKRVLIDTSVGWHHQSSDSLPSDGTRPGSGQGLAGIPNTTWNAAHP